MRHTQKRQAQCLKEAYAVRRRRRMKARAHVLKPQGSKTLPVHASTMPTDVLAVCGLASLQSTAHNHNMQPFKQHRARSPWPFAHMSVLIGMLSVTAANLALRGPTVSVRHWPLLPHAPHTTHLVALPP